MSAFAYRALRASIGRFGLIVYAKRHLHIRMQLQQPGSLLILAIVLAPSARPRRSSSRR
jgi:hypothetical protein